MTQLDTVADAIRWWGACAGLLGLEDFRARMRTWKIERQFVAIPRPWIDIVAKVGVCGFLILAGLGIPIARRFGIDLQGVGFSAYMTVAWTCVSCAGWGYVISRAAPTWRVWLMTGVAAGMFILMLVAAWATAGG